MSILDPELATLAFCWRIERRDGVCLGFTTHDRDLMIDALCFRAAPGMLPSAISRTDGFDAGSLEVSGALTSDAISAKDLKDGRWDGASVWIFMVDWERPEEEQVPLARGVLGDVSSDGNGFSSELRGAAVALERPVVEQTSPTCRAELGDKRCRVDMAPRTLVTRIVAAPGEAQLQVSDVTAGGNGYGYGRLRWISGRNSGLESSLLRSEGELLSLREPPCHPAEAGDLVEIAEGCDKSFETCAGRFANAANFRGEPYLPGMDLLTRYPGA
jgi:uncharacterized phage protein (TIGR02218 family)